MTTFDEHRNLALGTVSAGSTVIDSATGDTIVAGSDAEAAEFPAVPFYATLWRDQTPTRPAVEIVRATAFDGVRTFTVLRAQQGTAAQAFVTQGWKFANTITAADVVAIEDAVTSGEAGLAAETAARESADTALQGDISAEATARAAGDAATLSGAEAYTDGEVSAEASARAAGDAATLAAAEGYSDSHVAAEAAARVAGDAATLVSAEGYADGEVSAEATTRASADATLQTHIDSEATARASGDAATLSSSEGYTDGKVAAEAGLRVSGDAATLASAEAYTDGKVVAAVRYRGAIDASTNPNLPAANLGDLYAISVAGTVSGVVVEAGDMALCKVDGTPANTPANWDIVQTNINGAVTGPASAADRDFAQFNGTSGKVIQDGGLSLDTDGALGANSDLRIPSQKAVRTAIANGPMTPIATVQLAADAATIDFPNIPQTFGRLLLVVRARNDEAGQSRSKVWIAFNGDTTAANYADARIFGSGSGAGGDANASTPEIGFVTGDAADTDAFGSIVAMIGGYTDAHRKTVLSWYGNVSHALATTLGIAGVSAVSWNSTAVVNRVTIRPQNGGNFRAGSIATLYGLADALPNAGSITTYAPGLLPSMTKGYIYVPSTGDPAVDAADLANAISMLPATGGEIRLDGGPYDITNGVNDNKPIRWSGGGPNGVSIPSDGSFYIGHGTIMKSTSPTGVGIAVNSDGVSFERMVFQNAALATAGAAVQVQSFGKALRFIDCGFSGFYQQVDFLDGAQWFIDRCLFIDPVLNCLSIQDQDQPDSICAAISDTTFIAGPTHLTPNAGIYWKSGGGLRINNSKMSIRAGSGFAHGLHMQIADGVSTSILLMTGCSIEDVVEAVRLEQAGTTGQFSKVAIVGNHLRGNANAIVLNGTTTLHLQYAVVDGNILESSGGQAAISINNINGLRIGDANEYVLSPSALAWSGTNTRILFRERVFTTAARPPASMMRAMATYYDSTLNKVGVADGNGNWRDTMGNII